MGSCTKETAFSILYHTSDRNFIDTANHHQGGETETWLREWLSLRQNRSEIVLATKFSPNYMLGDSKDGSILSNYGDNNSKALKPSAENSPRLLQTSY